MNNMTKNPTAMENKDKPAAPCVHVNIDGTYDYAVNMGLTKREMIAAMCLQGLLANPEPTFFNLKDVDKAAYAVIMADVLLTQLEKQ